MTPMDVRDHDGVSLWRRIPTLKFLVGRARKTGFNKSL